MYIYIYIYVCVCVCVCYELLIKNNFVIKILKLVLPNTVDVAIKSFLASFPHQH